MPDFRSYKKAAVRTMFRKKDENDLEKHQDTPRLNRILGLGDLTSLGVGSTLGLGAYVLAGKVARTSAGPAVIFSFFFAAVASTLSGLCYAEFASRVPKAGSAYAFSYVGVGELIAFLIGWDLILEFSIGGASVARSLSEHVDKLIGGYMHPFFNSTLHMSDTEYVANYPDLFAIACILILTLLIAWGMRESSLLNNLFTTINMLTVGVVVVSGYFFVDLKNWDLPGDLTQPDKIGEGGFLPFGWMGVLKGATVCFYGFIGFDAIATSGEEAKNPSRNIPLAIVGSLIIITVVYCCLAVILTLMLPYYNQDTQAPFIEIYRNSHNTTLYYIVSCGAIFAICATMIGSLYPLPRILYAMSSDGLLFKIFSKIDPKTRTPFWGTIICGTFCSILAFVFDGDDLIDMMSIGTLMAYSLVCLCILIMRYRYDNTNEHIIESNGHGPRNYVANGTTTNQLVSKQAGRTSLIILWIFLALAVCFGVVFKLSLPSTPDKKNQNNNTSVETAETTTPTYVNGTTAIDENEKTFSVIGIWVCSILSLCMLLMIIILSRRPQGHNLAQFRVPFVPFIPCLSIVLNIILMSLLKDQTWWRFFSWMLIGILIYVFYGIRHSEERYKHLKPTSSNDPAELEPMHNGVLKSYESEKE